MAGPLGLEYKAEIEATSDGYPIFCSQSIGVLTLEVEIFVAHLSCAVDLIDSRRVAINS